MTAPTRHELSARLRKTAHEAQWLGWERATIGGYDGSGNRIVEAEGRPGWVIVRIDRGSEVTQTVALNTRVKSAFGARVWVGENEEGKLSVMRILEGEMVSVVGRGAAALAVPDVVTTGLITERRFEPGLVAPRTLAGEYTMSVYIYSFVYTSTDGRLVEYPGGWLDLTANVPTTAGMRRWALVGINPNGNTAIAVNGATYGTAATLNMTQLADVDPAGMIPLAGVNLEYGMTAIDRESYILDARAFLGGSVSGSVGGLAPSGAGAFNPNLPPETPSAYDDEFDDASLDGAWAEVDDGDTLSASEAGGVLTLTNTGYVYPYNYPRVMRDAPTGDFQFTAKLTIDSGVDLQTAYYLAGLVITFPTAGKSLSLIYGGASGGGSLASLSIKATAGGPDVSYGAGSFGTVPAAVYLRIRYDRGNAVAAGEVSADGITWQSYLLDASAIGEAPAKIGVFLSTDTEYTADYDLFRVVEAFGASTDWLYGDYEAVLADAANISYTPDDGGDWTDPDPTNVQDALDALAAAVVAPAPNLDVYTDDVSNPPTDAELDAAIGTPAAVGAGYRALVDDGGAGTNVYLVASTGSVWTYAALTVAT